VGAEGFLFPEGEGLRVFKGEAGPVDRAVIEVLDAEAGDGFGGVKQALPAFAPHLSVVEMMMPEEKRLSPRAAK
jgi:hypothetical protein